ncbi:hypothetical protein [Roseateles sp.]|uniref:hypothetical protein n=1 Tax=Roseateles sp. TaxID=1971397 RepID=UPI0032659B81
MKHALLPLLALAAVLGAGSAQAGPIGLNGRDLDGNLANGAEAYYDTTLNITWLADADYAKTSGYDADGLMQFTQAKAWAAQLTVGGISGWRLPKITDPTLPCAPGWSTANCGFNPQPGSSEIASMFFDTLGNIGSRDSVGGWRPGVSGVDFGMVNTGPFQNLQNERYWFGTPYQFDYYDDAWHFDFRDGAQGFLIKEYDFHSWAVHDGDVGRPTATVPEPRGILLVLIGLAALAVGRARRIQQS